MKYLIIPLLLLLFASSAYAQGGGIDMLVVDKDSKGTNVREAPDGKVTHVIPYGGKTDAAIEMRRVTVTGQDGQWFHVRLADKSTGWMHASVLGSCASSTEDGEPYMYAQPDDSSPTVARLKEGTRLRLLELGQAQGWYKVETASGAKKSGWMMRHTLVPNPYNTCWK